MLRYFAWTSGLSQSSIAKRFGISQASVHRVLQGQGELDAKLTRVRRVSERFTPEQLQGIVSDYLAGMKQREVVEKYGISTSTLKRILKKYEIKRGG